MSHFSRVLVLAIGVLSAMLVATSSLASGAAAQGTDASDRSVLDGVFSLKQASRGQEEFQRACVSCHNVSDHAGRKFGTRWTGTTLGELFDFLSNAMPKSDPGSLAPEAYSSILAFFLKESGYKEGDKDLPSDLESLKRVRIEPLSP